MQQKFLKANIQSSSTALMKRKFYRQLQMRQWLKYPKTANIFLVKILHLSWCFLKYSEEWQTM